MRTVGTDGFKILTMKILQAISKEQINNARALFREYESWLGLDLCFQGFEEELKSLYVRDEFRGQRIGNSLVDRIIDEARSAGYAKMRLDTYPAKMGKAVKLYESHGFREIEPYYSNPHDGVLFMEMDL